MNRNYSECYRVLGLTPPYYWEDVRTAYRSLSRQWHPDRHPDGPAQAVANERMKAINNAYTAIAGYYQTYRTLPSTPEATADEMPFDATPGGGPPNADSTDPAPQMAAAAPSEHTVRHGGGKLRSAIVGLVVIAVVYAYVTTGHTPLPSSAEHADEHSPSAPPADVATAIEPLPAQGYFGAGSTPPEVLAVQGKPSEMDDRVWHYGESRVLFSGGVVHSWIEHPDHPLKLRRQAGMPTSSPGQPETFVAGSTMAEVLAVQGEPIHASGEVWEYGGSRIYFKNGRVVSWHDSPLAPLKVRR